MSYSSRFPIVVNKVCSEVAPEELPQLEVTAKLKIAKLLFASLKVAIIHNLSTNESIT